MIVNYYGSNGLWVAEALYYNISGNHKNVSGMPEGKIRESKYSIAKHR
jgi:hypothetical protein